MNGSGLLVETAALSPSSGTKPQRIDGRTFQVDDLLSDLSPAARYRTPAEIRAIPNEQWEAWIHGNNLPFTSFSAAAGCQECLRTIVKATVRRMEAE